MKKVMGYSLVLQVRPKYIQCVAISCFYIAAKTLEEDEVRKFYCTKFSRPFIGFWPRNCSFNSWKFQNFFRSLAQGSNFLKMKYCSVEKFCMLRTFDKLLRLTVKRVHRCRIWLICTDHLSIVNMKEALFQVQDWNVAGFVTVLQVIPSAVDLVKTSQCGCAVSDILRMEMIVLNKLQWSVKSVTQIDYLHIVSCSKITFSSLYIVVFFGMIAKFVQ